MDREGEFNELVIYKINVLKVKYLSVIFVVYFYKC